MRPELLLTEAPVPASRYRRRIIILGLALALVALGVGAPIYLAGIERDLERRVPGELAAVGVTGLSASFSGQEGVLRCDAPLGDPEGVLEVANAVNGVAAVSLDRSCRVMTAPVVATTLPAPDPVVVTTSAPSTTGPADGDDPDVGPAGAATRSTAHATAAEFTTVGEIVDSSTRFSVLSGLVGEAGLADTFGGDGLVTVFAPTDEAFDDLSADLLAEMRADPDVLAQVLRHHVVAGLVPLAELQPGTLTNLGGGGLTIGAADGAPTVAGAIVGDGDLRAVNGVVHVLDRVLLPDDLDLRSIAGLPEFAAVLGTGTIGLSGSVTSEVQRLRLVTAAATELDRSNVTDDITSDPSSAFDGPVLEAMVELLGVLPVTMTAGSVTFDGVGLSVVGTVVDDDARSVLDGIAARDEVVLDLTDRAVATPDDILEMQADLDALVRDRPLRFEPGSAELDDEGQAVLDVAAALIRRFGGVRVTVEGHTDTAGNPPSNLDLSDVRAAAVFLGLVDRQLPVERLDHVGRGDTQPLLVGGVEDPEASRRVVFVVGAESTS